MNHIAWLTAGTGMLFLVGCGGGLKSIDVTENAPIAVVSFSLNKSIVEEGKEADNGPGLLQKADNYYKNHQEAVNQLWSDFKSDYRDVLLGTDVIDVESIVSNEQYRELSKHIPKMVMGKDIASGGSALLAQGGLNHVSSGDTEKMDKIAALLNAKLLMCIDYSGSYAMSTGVSIGGFGAGAAKMKLSASVVLYEPGKGVVLRQSFKADSDDVFPLVGGILLSENYAKGLSTAQAKLLPQIKQYLKTQQTKAKEDAQQS